MKSKRIEITREMIERELGCEINNFKLKPLYEGVECIGLDVFVEPKMSIKEMTIPITIKKSSEL